MSIFAKPSRARLKDALRLFLKLRGVEFVSIMLMTLTFELAHQLHVGIFPSAPLTVFMVPFGLYIGFGYLAIVALASLPLIVFDLQRNPIALISINTLPLIGLGAVILCSLFDTGYPRTLIYTWVAAALTNVVAALIVSKRAQ